ncbi:MAG TPA: exodeoxyribonuclease VII small subunit [Candidatus Acidoferrales bacterium]|nr:exodeoxyribonuclease VII small subunit [Candidatus Acidoferrales bacterium]
MAKTNAKQIDRTNAGLKKKPSFEEALARLEGIVEQLDDGELPLAKSLELFKEGRTLAAFCRGLLEQAELDVKTALEQPRQIADYDAGLPDDGRVLDEEDGA